MNDINWPFARTPQPMINRAEGLYLYDAEGNAILDAAGGAIVCNIGHGRERVAEAVRKATLDTSYVVPPWHTPSRAALVEALEQHWLPPELRRIHVTSGGSEAVEAAMKVALLYQSAIGQPQRSVVISRALSYHGTTLTTAAVSGHAARKRGLESALNDNPKAATPYPLRCPLGPHHPDAGAYYLADLRATFERVGPERVAAVVGEPVIGASGGAIVPPADYWPGVRALCDEYGALLVLDEVMTGFGRTGTRFGYQHWVAQPDILVGGKGLAGGYAPLGAVFTTEPIGSAIDAAGYTVMFHTFGAHPGACAAAAEVLAILEEEALVERARVQGEALLSALHDAFDQHPQVAEVRGLGLLQAIEIVADRDTLEPFPEAAGITNRAVAEALKRGVFFYAGGTGEVRDMLVIGPAFTLEANHIDQIVSVARQAVEAAVAQANR